MKGSKSSTAAWLLPLLPLAAAYCPPVGQVLPPPQVPKCPSALNAALKGALDKAASATNSSFSVQITSKNNTLFEYHQTGADLDPTGVDEVDGNTVYRVASVSKLFTAFALFIQEGVNIDLPASEYIPELSELKGYEDTTLRMLATHLAAVPRDTYSFDFLHQLNNFDVDVLEMLGFDEPPVAKDMPTCDNFLNGGTPCTRAELFDVLAFAGRTWQPGHRAAYANIPFILLGFAVESITDMPYTEAVAKYITGPLDMASTGFEADLTKMVIANGSLEVAALPVDNYNATGGLYSTNNDLTTLMRAILNNDLMTDAQTQMWLKPASFVSSMNSGVGAPWEIVRADNLTPAPRPVDIYTKSGDLPGYSAMVGVIPEYEVGFAVNTHGADAARLSRGALDIIMLGAVPFFDNLAREQAKAAYAGSYVSEADGNKTALSLSVDKGPGLVVKEWSKNGADMLQLLSMTRGGADIDARIYPVGKDGRWLMQVETVAEEVSVDESIMANVCVTWASTDAQRLGGLPMDEFDFTSEGGEVKEVAVPGLRVRYAKI